MLQEAQEELIVRLRESVKIHLMTEVPLGAFLSGGVDSSAVVAMMANLMEEPVNTCSISFGDPAFNESQYAQKVADRYHTQHNVGQVDAGRFRSYRQAGLPCMMNPLPTVRPCPPIGFANWPGNA